MGLFSGLEKFGLGSVNVDNLYDDGEKKSKAEKAEAAKKPAEELKETDFLLDKSVHCPVCDHDFKMRAVKSSKARRIGADRDLRPRFVGIDTLKYEVCSCPKCGYTAMNRYFPHLASVQIKLLTENVKMKFQPVNEPEPQTYTYDQALDRYKLSLLCTVVKKGKISERAYTCLKISWLLRGKGEELIEQGKAPNSPEVLECQKEETEFYEQAYEGLEKAVASESFPICGMDQNTVDMLLAEMAFKLGKYETASKLVSRLIVSTTTSGKIKDKAHDLKDEILAKMSKG